jgi:hypothetical protein
MRFLTTAASLFLCLFLLTGSARAEGRVQLALQGALDARGGARIEAEVEFVFTGTEGPELRTASLNLQLAEGTSAADIVELLRYDITRRGGSSLYTGERAQQRNVANLFIENVTRIALRLGRGVMCNITLCETSASSVHITPPLDTPDGAQLVVEASTFHPHTKARRRVSLTFELDQRQNATEISSKLTRRALESGWSGENTNHDTWRPGLMTDGGLVEGVSFDFKSSGDWRFELGLPTRS